MHGALNIKNLPDPLYASLKLRAESQHRSVAQEVTHILSEVLARDEPLSILDSQGLGKEFWEGMDAAQHVAGERDSWD
jgi:plasmid stability protein